MGMRGWWVAVVFIGCSSDPTAQSSDLAAVDSNVEDLNAAHSDLSLGDLSTEDAPPTLDMPGLDMRQSQQDFAGAPMTDMAQSPDLLLPDLEPACVPRGSACTPSSVCCPGSLPPPAYVGSVDNSCQSNVCCTTIQYYAPSCAPGHYQWATNCGSSWTYGACN